MASTVDSLRRQTLLVAAAVGAGLATVGASEPRWLLGSLLVWGYCFAILFRGLPDNRPRERDPVFATLGVATWVTLFRGVLLAVASGFLFLPPIGTGAAAFLPAASYSLASILDHVDGRVARALDRTTRLGESLDMEIDAAGVLIASLLAIHYGKVPLWYGGVGLLRYAFVAGQKLRRLRGLPLRELDPSKLRRVLAGVQMGFLSVSLWPPVPTEWTLALAPWFGVATIAMFARDWGVVSTRLSPRP